MLILLADLIYNELLFKYFCHIGFNKTFCSTLLFLLFFSAMLGGMLSFFSSKNQNRLTKILLFIFGFWTGAEIIYSQIFEVYLSFDSLTLADQLADGFLVTSFKDIFSHPLIIILVFLPLIIYSFIKKKENAPKKHLILLGLLSLFLFFMTLDSFSEEVSLKELCFKVQNNELNKENLGILPSVTLEFSKIVFGFEEEIIIEETRQEEIIEEPVYQPRITIDLDSKNQTCTDDTLKQMNTFFSQEEYTFTNQHTGQFTGKNLILFMAESFSAYSVDPVLTPTLYHLIHDGYYFENYYTPTILSTIGGEFQELTGLYPNLKMLSRKWRTGVNYYPFALGSLFKERGYTVKAYHDSSYTFQDRNVYLDSLGFDDYLGAGNGLEKRMDVKFPGKDSEMIETTYEDYIHDPQFFVYYVTVSGHKNYSMNSRISSQYIDLVKDLPYSDTVKAYIASQIELDRALESLLKHLEENGRLEDTLIALSADHYPYGLTDQQMKEMAGERMDSTIQINRNAFILYNAATPSQTISKTGSSLDVLPTILNLFDFPYDSRLIIGKDLFAPGEGIAMFVNRSWISDSGYYKSGSGKFYPLKELADPQAYQEEKDRLVNSRIQMSKLIMEKDYYRYLYE